ncbi:MAG: hypothetical protein M1839_002834 [Geoglossum umbratile]|nr:MAG: hypothetical protein M1839_002834 [Geoglossum umbratile]
MAGFGGVGEFTGSPRSLSNDVIDMEAAILMHECSGFTPATMLDLRKHKKISLARELALPGIDDPEIDTLQLALKWVSDDTNSPWLLVLDNADGMDIRFGASPHLSSQQSGQRPVDALAGYSP